MYKNASTGPAASILKPAKHLNRNNISHLLVMKHTANVIGPARGSSTWLFMMVMN
jgi:hypothetical protein